MSGNFSECIVCGTTVSRRHQAIECDLCQRWQHRVCNTGKYFNFYYHFFLALSKLNVFADENFSVAQMVQLFIDRVENIVEKAKNAVYCRLRLTEEIR